MKKNLLKILLIILLVIFQMSLFSKFSILDVIPNVIFILSVIFVFKGLTSEGFLVATFGGFLLDLSSPFRFGVYTLILLAMILCIQFILLKNIPEPNPWMIFLSFIGVFLLLNLIIFGLSRITPSWQLVIDTLINSLWGIIIYLIVEKMLKPKERLELA